MKKKAIFLEAFFFIIRKNLVWFISFRKYPEVPFARPNIVFILADDLGVFDLSAGDSPFYESLERVHIKK
jgi:hypothetical protein